MAANVLSSKRAVEASIYVVRAFVKLRQQLVSHTELALKLDLLEQKIVTHDQAICSLFDAILKLMTPPEPSIKHPIGFVVGEEESVISTLSLAPNDLYFSDMKKAFPSADEIERDFLKIRDRSPAARLMCPESIKRLHYSDQDGAYASIALMAYGDRLLPRLDRLIKKFKIETRATPRFLENRLKEKWLKKVPNGKLQSIRKAGANTLSALSELVVADYISSQKGCSITTMEAWKDSSPDIQYKIRGNLTNIEIKHFGETPELQAIICEQIKTKCSRAIYFNERRCADYIFGRIASAVLQLKKHPKGRSEIWLVLHPLSQRDIFERLYLKNGEKWNDKKFVLELFNKTISSNKPCEWLQEVDCLVLATLKDWHLKNIKRYRF